MHQTAAAVALSVYPGNTTIDVESPRQFTAYVPMSPNTVEWLVNDVVGGSATFGKISATGAYVAPATVPTPNTIVVKARSTVDAASFGTVSVAILRKYPNLWSTNPSKVSVGNFQISLNGSNFAPDSQVLVNGAPVTTTYVSPTALIAAGNAAAVGTLQVAVKQPGAGSQTGNSVALSVIATPVVVTVSPTSASVLLGTTKTFTAAVSGSANPAVTWTLTSGGGAINASSGVYTAPAQMPASTAATVRATSVASPSSFATATVTLTAPPPPPIVVTVTPASTTVQLGTSKAFSSTVTGTANTAVTWSITSGGGSIDANSGVYTAPAAMPNSPTVNLKAKSLANGTSAASATVTLTPPPPPAVWLSGARFLEQSSFGPSPASLAEVQQKGIVNYLNDQLALPVVDIPTPSTNSIGELRQWCLHNYTTAPDQLRQRVAYSLSQIIVTSSNKLIYPDAMLPWLRLLNQHAFGNYRDLLRDVTKCPSMGKYLDLAFSSKPSMAAGANENYARELMQLFTIGLWELNDDGSQKLGPNNQPIATYNQQTVEQMALALTGWVYVNNAYEDFSAPMVPQASRHATGAKSILGHALPAGQSVQEDLESVLDALMDHPNIAPFISIRLIRSLVKSNPSPGYVKRIAGVFENNGQGIKGDLKAVITAILLDQEARNDIPDANAGRLKEPILNICGLLRALGGHFNSEQGLCYLFEYMAQPVLGPPSVFSWFSPMYRVPDFPALFGPEFQIYSPTDASLRGNFMFAVLNHPGNDVTIDLGPFQAYGYDMAGLVEAVNQRLLYGRMPAGMKQALIDAAAPGWDTKTRIETVLYLTAMSGQYAVQY